MRNRLFLILLAAAPLILCTGASFGEFVKKEYRNAFLSPALQKDYYKIEVKTTRFFDRQQSNVNGLVESFRGTSTYSYDLFTRAFTYGKGGVLDWQAFTYDGAVAALSYALAGQNKKAMDILKTYRREFYVPKGDSLGLYNSYRSDMPDNGGLALGIDGDRIHFGPVVWVGLAALQYTALTGDLQFLAFAIDIAKWGQRLNHYRFPDGERGAVCMGSGWGPDWSQIYSTENNVDYYAFLNLLREIYQKGDERIRVIYHRKNFGLADMDPEIRGVKRWMKEVMYDRKDSFLYCGYNEKGCDRTLALDTVSWSIAAFGPEELRSMEIDPFGLADFAERKFLVSGNIDGEIVEGFDFTDTSSRRKLLKMIWLEGTGQQIVAYQILSRYAQKIGLADKAEEYRQKAIKFSDEMEKVSRLVKMIDGALPYTSRRPAEKEVLLTFEYEWEVPRGNKGQWVASVSSTAWRYFALAGFNPMAFDTETVAYKLFAEKRSN